MADWLVLGLLLSVATAVVIAGIFLVGARLFPTPEASKASYVLGESKRRVEIRQYLRSIGEEFAEDHFVEGQHVAFYLPERDVAITFDARAYFRIEKSPTYGVLVEHEMPGIHLGDRLPFETPELADDEDVDTTQAAFAILGLSTGATLSDVKSAYRDRVKEVHPDHGGSREEFQRVREAYTTAKKHAS
ncbi:molecular chaperone DnaJ [halophilic archaeon]|nr:molecular chaperone DnaJ [halophilic archaeon]